MDPKDNLRKFESQQRGEKDISLPPIMDVCSGPEGTRICPFLPAQILMMPLNAPASIISAGQQQGAAFVRQYTPCVKEKCMAWDQDKSCLLIKP